MRGRLTRAVLAWLCLAAAGPSVAQSADQETESAPRTAGITVTRLDGAMRIEAIVPGILWSVARTLDAESGGAFTAWLLVGPQGDADAKQNRSDPGESFSVTLGPGGLNVDRFFDTRRSSSVAGTGRLFRVRLEEGGSIESIPVELPEQIRWLSAWNLAAEEGTSLFAGAEGRMFRLRPGAAVRDDDVKPRPAFVPAIVDPGLATSGGPPWLSLHPDELPAVPADALGHVRMHVASDMPGDEAWRVIGDHPLPFHARLGRRRIVVSSPRILGGTQDAQGARHWVALPRLGRAQRIPISIYELDARGAFAYRESWIRFERLESVERTNTFTIDGIPALALVTRRADKVEIFGKPDLRVFRLDEDRTRSGQDPLFSDESLNRQERRGRPVARDVDGDGRDDVIWMVRGDNAVRFAVWTRNDAGNFRSSPRRVKIKLEQTPSAVVFDGHGDIDGDGLPDLVIQVEDALQIHRGVPPGRRGWKLVEKEPAWRVPAERYDFGAVFRERIVLSDTDGDGRDEVILIDGTGPDGRGSIRIYRFDRLDG